MTHMQNMGATHIPLFFHERSSCPPRQAPFRLSINNHAKSESLRHAFGDAAIFVHIARNQGNIIAPCLFFEQCLDDQILYGGQS
jgi:hypothetical protein